MKKHFVALMMVLSVSGVSYVMAQDDEEGMPTASFSDEGVNSEVGDMPVADETIPTDATQVQQYTIRQGDTLWDICQIALSNPWYWPKLWSFNQYILNPNLIYPGNRLVFSPGSDTSYPSFEVVQGNEDSTQEAPAVAQAPITSNAPQEDLNIIIEPSSTRKEDSVTVKLRPISFVSPKGIKTVGKVIHSMEPKMNLMFGDKVYLKVYEKKTVNVGDRYQVIERVKMVFDPDRITKKIGWMIRKKGQVTVTKVLDGESYRRRVIEATISDGDDAILREDELIPYESNIKSVIPHFTDKQIYGKIVEADSEQFMISNNDFVFLNIGTNNGVQPGLQMYVVRRGDGMSPEEGKDLPDVAVARILVVETREKTSTAYVSTLSQPLSVGDRIRSRLE